LTPVKESKMTNQKAKGNPYIWLLVILILGFLIRLWILDERWINPDEGAHLMDGKLVLDGFIPEIDYSSRQPLYVYIVAMIFKIFGIGYIKVRFFLPLISTMGVCLLIFSMSKKLFNEKVALLASAIYTFLPLSIIESTTVKTEPLTTLLSCIGIYLVISGVRSEKKSGLLFFLSGVFLSLAFYVRESSLAIPLAVFLFFIVAYWGKFQKLFINYGITLCGYFFTCLAFFAYYSRFITINQILNSSINPLNFILKNFQKVSGLVETDAVGAEFNSFRLADQSWSETLGYLKFTLFTNSFLFVGFIFSILILTYSLLTKEDNEDFKEVFLPFSLLYSWLFSLAIAYSYWTIHRGFFVQYFEEFLPPLSVLLAFVIVYFISKLELQKRVCINMAIITFFLLIIVFFFNRGFPDFQIKSVIYFLIATSVLAFFYFSQELRFKRWLYALITIGILSGALLKLASSSPHAVRVLLYLALLPLVYLVVFNVSGIRLKRDLKKELGFIVFSLLISSLVLSFAVSGRKMGVDFDSVWSPETVRETADYIRANSKESDEIMSGAVIWELESNRRPFMNQTHPLAYVSRIPEEEAKKMEWGLTKNPPRFIILDGYTEKTYLRQINKLQEIMDERYKLKKVVSGSRYPVKIYGLEASDLSN